MLLTGKLLGNRIYIMFVTELGFGTEGAANKEGSAYLTAGGHPSSLKWAIHRSVIH